MDVTIYGCGYVGLVTGLCLAELGHEVLCVDIDTQKIAQLESNVLPLYEPGLQELLVKNRQRQRIHFTTNLREGVNFSTLQLIAVNTPSLPNGGADITNIETVVRHIATHMNQYRLIVNKSTAPVGTVQLMKRIMLEVLRDKNTFCEFDVASNPEFLKEGAAVQDCLHPDRILLGTENNRALALLKELYASFPAEKILAMDIPSAELSKYAANALLATKISFINEIANLAEHLQANIKSIQQALSLDPRIGPHFINPGCGYGGSCFPKDIKALIHSAQAIGFTPHLIAAGKQVNDQQKNIMAHKVLNFFDKDVRGRTFALWGLAFKPNTNDVREAPSHTIMAKLWSEGAYIKAYDPAAMPEMQKVYGHEAKLILCPHKEATLENADALIIATEWSEFYAADLSFIKDKLKNPVIFDGRNIFDAKHCEKLGIIYHGIGWGTQTSHLLQSLDPQKI